MTADTKTTGSTSSNVRTGWLAALLRAVPGVNNLARWLDNRVLLPLALRRAGWHFGPHYKRIGKRKLMGMLRGTFEGETLAVFRRITPKGAVALDVGANFGFFSRHLSVLVGSSGRVFSFEAHPDVFAYLKRNMSHCSNIRSFNLAVSDKGGELEFNSMDNPLAHSLFATGGATGNWHVERRIRVPAARIDAVLADVDLADRPMVVKMDIEGAELIALEGMTELLARAPDVGMVVEYAPACLEASGAVPRALLDLLWRQGFEIYPIEHPVEELLAPPSPDWHSNLLCLRGAFARAGIDGLSKLLPEHLV